MISKVRLHNLFSYEDAEFEFDKGVTLIEGWNHDDGTPEGSGKSAIPNAITWVIFGKLPKDATIDSVIRETAKSGQGEVELRNGSKVVRKRKPNDLFIIENGKELRGKDAKETQLWIEQRMGMGFETFCQAVYFPQNYEKKFVTSSETEKAAIISEIQDLNDFTEAKKATAKLCTAQEAQLKRVEGQLELASAQEAQFSQALGENEQLLTEFKRKKMARIETLTKEVQAVEKEIGRIVQGRSASAIEGELAAKTREVDELSDVAAEIKSRIREIERGQIEREKAQADLDRADKNLKAAKESEIVLYNRLSELENQALDDVVISEVQTDLNSMDFERSEIKGALASARQQAESQSKLLKRIESDGRALERTTRELSAFSAMTVKACPTCGAAMSEQKAKKREMELREQVSLQEKELSDLVKDYESSQSKEPSDLEAALALLEKLLAEKKSILTRQEARTLKYKELNLEVKAEVNRASAAEEAHAICCERVENLANLGSAENLKIDLADVHQVLEALSVESKRLQRESQEGREAEFRKRSLVDQVSRLMKERDSEVGRSSQSLEVVVETARKRLADSQKMVSERETEYRKVLETIARLETLKQGFGEVKSYVFKGLLGELTRKANKFLNELFEVPVAIRFSNEGEDGEISKIHVFVTIYGVERPLGLFSGGQSRRIQIAVDLALSEIIASRSQKKMDLRFFDEPFKDLSEVSMEKAVRLFESLKGSTIIIEHNSIAKSIVQNLIRVELTDKVSRRTA